jgi:peptide deformylase
MTVRDIRLFGDPVLREVCRPVTDFGAGLARLVTGLADTCRLPGRAGLAAPQIGVDLRVFCYNVDGEEGYVINPRLVSSDGHQDGPEGCLSIPGLYTPTPRARIRSQPREACCAEIGVPDSGLMSSVARMYQAVVPVCSEAYT